MQRRNRPNLAIGDLVYARVAVASRDMEPELACTDDGGKVGSFRFPNVTVSGHEGGIKLHAVQQHSYTQCCFLLCFRIHQSCVCRAICCSLTRVASSCTGVSVAWRITLCRPAILTGVRIWAADWRLPVLSTHIPGAHTKYQASPPLGSFEVHRASSRISSAPSMHCPEPAIPGTCH